MQIIVKHGTPKRNQRNKINYSGSLLKKHSLLKKELKMRPKTSRGSAACPGSKNPLLNIPTKNGIIYEYALVQITTWMI